MDMSWPIIGAQIMSTVLSAGGQVAKGDAQLQVGQRNAAAARFQADQLDQSASGQVASGQIAGQSQEMQTSYIVSQALARAAASGGGASDPTVINNIARIQGEGAFRANAARYQGTTQGDLSKRQAAALRFQADTEIADAEKAKSASNLSAFSTVLSGAAKTMYGKYGMADSGYTSRPAMDAGSFNTVG